MGNKPKTVDRKLRELEDRLVDDVVDDAETFLEVVLRRAGANISLNPSNDASGDLATLLATSGQPFRTATDDAAQLSISLPPEYKYLEYGTGAAGRATDDAEGSHQFYKAPSSPPVEPIAEWIDEKGVEPDDPDMSADELAFVIAQQIAEVGNEAHPFLRPAYYQRLERFTGPPGVENRINRTVRDVF